MNAMMIPLAAICGLTLGAVGLSLLALFRSKAPVAAPEEMRAAAPEIEEMRVQLYGMAEEIRRLQDQPAAAAGIPSPRAGLNLSKRSQALRLHRRGDSAQQISAALEIPWQEVDLLIKVHRIATSGA